jgi:luciferase-type oxidoreductase
MRDVGLLPKPAGARIPLLVTGNSGQSLDWIAEHGDGWLMYPKPIPEQRQVLARWHRALDETGTAPKPFSQSLYVDLTEDPGTGPTAIHLGFRAGRDYLTEHLGQLREIGVNHVLLNLKYGRRPAPEVLHELAEHVLPSFPTVTGQAVGSP